MFPEAAPVAPPCAMVIFGAAGDLTKRLVVPALYNLVNAKRLSENFQIVGVDLASKTAEEWRQGLTDMMNEFVTKGGGEFEADHIEKDAWEWLTSRMTYLQGDLTDPGCYKRVGEHLAELDKTKSTARQSSLLSGGGRPLLRHRRRSARRRRAGDGRRGPGLAPRGDREALRP